MKNNNVLKVRELHNRGIHSETKNFDLLSEFLLDFISDNNPRHYCNFAVIGFDFGVNGLVRQVQPLLDFDFVEAFNEAYHNGNKYGDSFCLLHHDLSGFHYLVF